MLSSPLAFSNNSEMPTERERDWELDAGFAPPWTALTLVAL